jgi:uncharacterized RDD family membrane protein YckC
MQTVKIRTSQNIEIEYEVAGLGDRVLARIVDTGVMMGVLYTLYFIIFIFLLSDINQFKAGSGVPISLIVIGIVFGLVIIFYDLVAEIFFNGQSIGKYAMKIKVANIDGSRPSIGQYFIRWVFRLIDFGITGGICAVISVAVSEKKQRVGDIIAGTTLIKTKPRTELSELFFISPDDTYEPVFPGVSSLTDKDITLVHEVISKFKSTGNSRLVYQLALRVKEHLGIETPKGMNDFDLLQTVVKDYNYVTSRTGVHE